MLNFQASVVPVKIILYVLFAGMTDFRVFRKDFSLVSPTQFFLYTVTLANVHFIQFISELIVPFRFVFFHFFDSLFYYPIWIAIDVFKHFLKMSNLTFQVLVVGAHFENS